MGQRGANQVSIDTQYTHSAMVTPSSGQPVVTPGPHHIPTESLYAELFNYLHTQTNKIPRPFISPKQRDPQKAGRISRDRDQIGYLHCLGDKNTENKNQIWSKHQGSTHKTANTN